MEFNKEKYITLKENITLVSKDYVTSDEINKFSEHIDIKVSNFNPTIMVYGVYNAGKSTLLNALFGINEMAKTNDVPETCEVKDYNYKGYTIYDTPGINAPIEHQKVTEEHLKKCELILFVLSNDASFEESYIYERIGEIIKSKKPILIVLNNKSGIDMNSTNAQAEIIKINQHLSTICDKNGIEKAETKVDISFVDAKTALEGKIEQEKELIDESKILLLEQKIDNLMESAGINEVENGLNIFISDYINKTLKIIDSKIDNPEMKKTQEMITYLEKLKQQLKLELKQIATDSVSIATKNLFELMLNRNEKNINNMIEKTTYEIAEQINQRIKQIQDELKLKINQFEVELKEISLKNPNFNIDLNVENSSTVSTNSSDATKGAIVAVGSVAVNLIPPVIPVGPVPVPARALAQIALALYTAFSGSDGARAKAQAQLDEKRQMQLSAKNQSDEFSLKYNNQLNTDIYNKIEEVFSGLLSGFIDLSNKLDNQNEELLKNKRELQFILNNLNKY